MGSKEKVLSDESQKQKLLLEKDYSKYGFKDPEQSVYKTPKGLSAQIVEEISKIKGEPKWMTEFRLKAFEHFKSRPMPMWGADLSKINFDDFTYYIKPTEKKATRWEEVPETIRKTFDRLGIPEAERKFLAGSGAMYDSDTVYHSIQDKLAKQGVIFTDMDSGLREHENIVKKFFGTVVPFTDNKFAALNSAVWSGGSFLFIPEGIHIDLPLQAYFRINAARMGQFERTLIIAEKNSSVHYLESCTAPVYSTDSLHAAVVEIIAMPGSRVQYTTIQNWSSDVYNLVTKRAFAHDNATVFWIDCNIGCLAGDTKIFVNNDLKEIRDVEVGDIVYSLTPEMNFVRQKVLGKKRNEPRQTYILRTENQREIVATANHPFLVLSKIGKFAFIEWKKMEDIKVGNLVAISGEIPDNGRSFAFDYKQERGNKKIIWPKQSNDELMWLIGFYFGDGYLDDNRVYFAVPTTDKSRKKVLDLMKSQFGLTPEIKKQVLRYNSVALVDFFSKIGLKGNAREKRLPPWIYKLPKNQKIAIIEGYIDADGYRRKGHKNISITSVNKQLLKDIKILAISCGLNPTKISKWTRKEKKPLGKEERGYSHYFLHFGENEFKSPIAFVQVSEIIPYAKMITYDIEVEGTSNFIANGFIVHNSKVTMKYPSVFMLGEGAKGEILSIAFASNGQHIDSGAKAVHLAPNTKSIITSKSISKDGGRTTYRGLVRVKRGATGVKSNVRCVKPDTLILGDNKAIADYRMGDHAIGLNHLNTVIQKIVNNFEGEMVKIKAVGMLPIEITPEHPVLTAVSKMTYPCIFRNGKHTHTARINLTQPFWKSACLLKDKKSNVNGNYLVVPKIKGDLDISELDLIPFINRNLLKNFIGKNLSTTFPLNENTAWLLGLYVAEGYSSQGHIKFALNSKEHELKNKILEISKKLCHHPTIYKRKDEDCIEIVLSNAPLSRAFEKWCGKYAHNKQIPEFILLHKNEKIVKSFLDGFISGDGYISSNCLGKKNIIHIVTTSKLLALQLQLIGARLDQFFRITKASRSAIIRGRKVNIHDKFDVRCNQSRKTHVKFNESFMFVPIRKIEKINYKGEVYNLETSDHSYIVSNAITHNCDALILDEESASDTIPYMEINEKDVTIQHEATVGKISEEQLFYLMSRGLKENEATAMIVRGFIEEFTKHLPLDYAVEMNRLIEIEMEGSVG